MKKEKKVKKVKKDKNQKKQKIEEMEKKPKWNLFLTLASVFLGVGVIAGATVLGVYLTGGFEEKVVHPESITFGYDENKYLEVDDDFSLTITSPTKEVTKDRVTLSFDKNLPVVRRKDGDVYKISNKIIEVPEVVTIGRPFTVHLLEERLLDDEGNEILKNGNPVDWIIGGLSTLYATSESPNTINTKINIAIDVPVYDTEVIIINSNGEETTQVVTNESFTVKTKFIPAKSEYMYSDNFRSDLSESEMRVKRSYYEPVNTDKVTRVYDDIHTMHFVAGQATVSESVGVQINSYTFITAKSQIEQETELESITDAESYHQRMLEVLVGSSISKVSDEKISIGEASIGNFTVAKNKVSMKAEQPLRLYMNQYSYQSVSDYLGVNVYSTSGLILDRLLSSIAINFQVDGKDVAYGENKILTVVGGDEAGRYVDINGQRYYKPNAQGTNMRYSYWDLTATSAAEVTMNIVLLVDNESSIFSTSGQEVIYNTKLSISKHEEQPLSWTDSSDLEIMLDYDKNGNIERYPLNLDSLKIIPAENIYQDYIFFVSFGSNGIADYQETVTKVFGEDGYDLARSGVYATNSGNLALFAIDRSVLNIYDTASFNLYFATIKTENGQPLYDNNGLYQIALMCSGYKHVECEKSLYTDSVTNGAIDTSNFPETNGEVSINQGSDLDFSVSFTVGKESVPVFKDEFQQGFMTPIIKDTAGSDITSYFTIDEGAFEVDAESGVGVLKYSFKVKPAVQIENEKGIYFGVVALNYNDGDDKDITWETPLVTSGENAQIICIYKPLANRITLDQGEIYTAFKNQIKVDQKLNVEGAFDTTIEAGSKTYTSINEFLNAFVGINGAFITITDQKGKAETLSGQWKFVIKEGDTSAIALSADYKSFTFKDTASKTANVKLYIQTLDERVKVEYEDKTEFIVDFAVTSIGVTSITYDTNTNTYVNSYSQATDEISLATVSKYGAKGSSSDFIVLKDLVNFYVADGSPYTNIAFKLTPQYILAGALSDEYLIDLYGENGMFTLYSDDSTEIAFDGDYSASNIRSTLLSKEIYKIKVNKDFAIEQILHFTASDEIGAVNTSLNLNILANIVVESNNYPASGETLYAGEGGAITLTNKVTDRNGGKSLTIKDLYGNEPYYIVYNDVNTRYELTTEVSDAYIAIFQSGKITFKDFWEVEKKSFRVFFQPEGDNIFAVTQVISFEVTRDLLVQEGDSAVYYVLGDPREIETFAKVSRITDTSKTPAISITYTFDNYLTYSNETVVKNSDAKFFFDYNQKVITTKLKVGLADYPNAVLKEIEVDIELYAGSGDIYNDIANVFKSIPTEAYTSENKAITQQVGNVDYFMMDMTQTAWTFGDLGTYKVKPVQRDYNGNYLTGIYTVSGVTEFQINFKTQKTLLYGLNDSARYITIKFYTNFSDTTELATMHLPIILSNVGYNTAVYNKGVEEGHELETAITNPEQLIEKKIYNEIDAGKITQILHEYAYDESATKGGLYLLKGLTASVNVYSLTNNNNAVINSIENGVLTLNHLASTQENVYIAFEMVIEDSGMSQNFYYLLKVTPDVVVENTIYAYDGTSEYIKRFNISKNIAIAENVNTLKVAVNSDKVTLRLTYNDIVKEIVLNKTNNNAEGVQNITLNTTDLFGNGTDNKLSTELKLNVLVVNGKADIYYNDELMFSSLAYTNQIVSVQVGDDTPFTTEADWSNVFAVSFSEDYRYMTYRPLVSEKMTITLKHTYVGSDSSLAVIGGEQYYSFIVNESAGNYSVGFTNGFDVSETDNYNLNIKNGEQKTYNLTINLLKNEMAGSSLNQTIEYNKLNIQVTEGKENIETPTYNSATGEFVLTTKDYIDADKKVVFTLYIEQGYLATMTVNLEANASATLIYGDDEETTDKNEATNVLVGGGEYGFGELFEVLLNNETATYTISAPTITGDSDFVTWDSTNNKVVVADLISNKVVTLEFTVDFGEGKTFTFSQEFVLQANITPKSSFAATGTTIAKQTHTITATDLYTGTLNNTTISLDAKSTSTAYAGISGNVVSTNFVADSITVELTLTVNLVFKNNGKDVTQPYTMTYTFNVIPSAVLSTNYPEPNSDVNMTFEYLEDGATFTNIIEFIKATPIFSDNTRVVIVKNDGSNEVVTPTTTLSDLTIMITEQSNAILAYSSDNKAISENEVITLSSGIIFSRGVSSSDASITLRVTYQQVSTEYYVKILKNSLTVNLNPVTNYLLAGDYKSGDTTTTVSYEKIYVDKTSTENLFAESRMIYVEMSDSMTNYANEYYLIFKDADSKYYSSRAVYFSASDQGKKLYFDLGTSMADKTYVGAYLASAVETLKWNLSIGSPITTSAGAEITEIKDSGSDKEITNYSSNLFITDLKKDSTTGLSVVVPRVTLANRIQMVYGQLEGEDVLVDYDKYSSIITTAFTFSEALDTIAKADNIVPNSFARKDGSTNGTKSFTLTYYYMPSLDIAVEEAITTNANYLQVEVNQEYMSLVSLLGIKHPSNNRAVSPSNFMTKGDGLTFTIIENDTDSKIQDSELQAIVDTYKTKYDTGDLKTYASNEQAIYVFTSGISNGTGCISDYAMIPFGAKNTGDFVLGQLDYKAGKFTKTFYIIMKVVPDYVVTYGGSADYAGVEENGTIVSNLDNAYRIAETTLTTIGGSNATVYKDFALLGENGYLSITHKNGTGEKQELSLAEFDIQMQKDITIDSLTYNYTENLIKKILYTDSPNTDWKLNSNIYTYEGTSKSLIFKNVKEVIFGNQYYMVEGEDEYGYKYRVYFLLQATKQTPVATNSIEIVEGGYFDIGVQYQLLTIQEETSGEEKSYHINSIPTTPQSVDTVNVPLVTLEGIEAWLFDENYTATAPNPTPIPGTSGSEAKYYLKTNGSETYPNANASARSGYAAGDNITFSSEDQKYLVMPDIYNISIEEINFYSANKTTPVMKEATRQSNTGGDFATASQEEVYFYGYHPRSPYTKYVQDDSGNNTDDVNPGLWQVGKIVDTDIYGSSTTASLTMIITLKYEKGSIKEFYDLPVNVNIRREVVIEEVNERVQRDGQSFAVANQFQGASKQPLAAELGDATYLNDTLEILVPSNSTVTFEMNLKRDLADTANDVDKTTSVTVQNNGSSHPTTKYISLSQYFGVNVNQGDTITISKCDNSATEFYYVTNNSGAIVNNKKSFTTGITKLEYTISAITNDIIYVEDASLLSSTGYYGVTKYYIVATKFGDASSEFTFHYRAIRNYTVTGMVYKLDREYTKEIGFTINSAYNADSKTWSAADIGAWCSAFTLYQGSSTSGAIEKSTITITPDTIQNYLRYSLKLDEDESTGMTMGKAEIDAKTGTIQLDPSFTTDQYIKVVIKMAVSGPDRNIEGTNDNTYITLATLNLSTVRTSTTA